jgi:hypothetical protein
MLENRFGESRLPTVGVELELQLVDASTLALRAGIEDVVRLMTRADSSGHRQPSLSPLLIHKALVDPLEASS